MGSIRFQLNRFDWLAIGKGALVAIAGALLTYLTPVVTGLDLGTATPIVVAVWSILANIARKWVADNSTSATL